MNILEKIIAHKKIEVEKAKSQISIEELELQGLFAKPCISLSSKLRQSEGLGVIAEFKRQSPSKGIINDKALPHEVVKAYEEAGVCGSSVLTDTDFFGGSLNDLLLVRKHVNIPLLRKDFMIDEYQLYEAKAYGADVVLLIAANLSIQLCEQLATKAKSLGLEVLLEVHNKEELDYVTDDVDIVGVNNRDLKTFTVSLEQSKELSQFISKEKVRISESGIKEAEDIFTLRDFGFNGYLIGENFMRNDPPGMACKSFLEELKAGA